MSNIRDFKITDTAGKKVADLPGSTLSGTIEQNKEAFDKLGELIIDHVNDSMDYLYEKGVDNVAEDVQQVDAKADAIDNKAIKNASDIAAVNTRVDYLQSCVGTPLVAATVAGMTDHDKIYVYTGSEADYTAGDWYYWNGAAWADGGVYNSVAFNTDTTLALSGRAADAKVTGDEITDLKEDINEISEQTKNLIVGVVEDTNINGSGKITTGTYSVVYAPIEQGTNYALTAKNYPTPYYAIYSSKPALNSLSYNSTRYNAITFTAPIDGYVGMIITKGEKENQIEKGTVPTAFVSPVTAKDLEARNTANEALTDLNTFVMKTQTIASGSLINGYIKNDGSVVSHNDYKCTDFIDISDAGINKTLEANCSIYSGASFAFYDSNKIVVEAIDGNNASDYGLVAGDGVFDIVVPAKAYYVRASLHTSTASFNFVSIKYASCSKRIAEDSPLSGINNTPSFIRCFKKIVCIGDSLTAGDFNTTSPTSGGVNDHDFSYPAYLKKMTGCEVLNIGQGSTSASNQTTSGNVGWETFADSTGFPIVNIGAGEWLDSDNLGQLYIIALGTNDISKLGSFTGESSTDINLADYTQNANTSVGCYAKIIQRILEATPKAKIMCVCISNERNTESTRTEANTKIKAIAAMFSNCYVIDTQTYCEPTLAEQTYFATYYKNGSHNNALGYLVRAKQLCSYIDWIIKNNIADFQNIMFIGTIYDYVD